MNNVIQKVLNLAAATAITMAIGAPTQRADAGASGTGRYARRRITRGQLIPFNLSFYIAPLKYRDQLARFGLSWVANKLF